MSLISLGIESSADKLGVGIVDSEGNILANNVRTFKPEIGQGVIPREAAEHHANNVTKLIELGLNEANLKLIDIDFISYTQGSGMGPCLRVDAIAARTLALKLNVPIVGVNHQIAHVEIGRLIGKMNDPIVLYVSGGNSQVIAFEGGRYRILGETLDIPVGNCLDVFGREMKFDASRSPMGAVVEKKAKLSDKYIDLPYVVKGMDFSFSGILTSALEIAKNELYDINTICNSLQETVFSMLTEVTERALAHTKKNEVLVCGGVAANKRLKEMLKLMAEEHNVNFVGLPAATAIDNGAMIAWLGHLMYKNGYQQKINDTKIIQNFRPETVDVFWR